LPFYQACFGKFLDFFSLFFYLKNVGEWFSKWLANSIDPIHEFLDHF